ncbi:MAG: hypothetical protein AAGI23_01945 [Bacteroidota bacterium]
MQDKDLDKIIADKLDKLDVPYQANSWEALEGKLDANDTEGQFDEQVRQRLEGVEMPYQSTYWDRFAQQLDQDKLLRKQLLRYKLTEALLVLLILITFVHIFSNPIGVQKLLSTRDIDIQKSAAPNQQIMAFMPEMEANHSLEAENTIPPIVELNETTTLTTTYTQKPTSTTTNTATSSKKSTQIANISTLADRATPQLQAAAVIEKTQQQTTESAAIEPLAIATLPTETAPTTMALQAPAPNKQFRVGMYVTSNIDQIKTPYDDILDLPPISQYASSYGGGVILSWKRDRIELETGFGYANKQYVPADNSAVRYYNTVEDLRNIELNLVHIPVQVRYDAVQKEKWQIYMLGGSSLHLAVQANYDVRRINAQQLLIPEPGNNSNAQQDLDLSDRQQEVLDEQGEPSKPASAKLKSKRFPNGLLSGGNYRDNSFYTLTLGAGLERYLDERVSVFLQPTLRQDIPMLGKGLGPNEDRISTIELMIGAKIGF